MPTLTQATFELIAEEIAASTVTANLTETQREDLALSFARRLRFTNERFDAWRFIVAATGVEDGTPTYQGLFEEARKSLLV